MIRTYSDVEINRNDWKKLLDESSVASYFQSPECYDFYCTLSFLTPFSVGVSENNQLVGVACGYVIADGGVVKRFFSRRAIIPGGLLLADNISEQALGELLKKLTKKLSKKLSKKAIYIEIRNNCDYSGYKEVFEFSEFNYRPHLNYVVDTSSIEQATANYSESKIRQIRKSKEQGVVCELTKNENDVTDFYSILSDLYKRKIKKPLFPKEFFDKFVLQPDCYLFVVKKDEQIIGGIACASLARKAVYEWFVCGDTKNYNYLFPNVVATHQGIEFAIQNGYKYFDFMGVGEPDKKYGVREFKARFGGRLVEHGRFLYICNPLLFHLGKMAIELKKIF